MIKIAQNWYELLKDEFEKPYFKTLQKFLDDEYNRYTVYPKIENVFNALNKTKFDDVKVVLIGQDPYHEPGQAHGLSFSVEEGTKIPRSLKNIYKEMASDLNIEIPKTGNLTCLAKQGVLLLNTVLTVRKGEANSHQNKGWEIFTSKIIKLLNDREKPIVFILWGNSAKKLGELITNKNHLILSSAHPSPYSAKSGFFGCKHFSKTNEFLKSKEIEEIDWLVR